MNELMDGFGSYHRDGSKCQCIDPRNSSIHGIRSSHRSGSVLEVDALLLQRTRFPIHMHLKTVDVEAKLAHCFNPFIHPGATKIE